MESSSFRFSLLCFFFIIAAIAGYSDVVVGECLYTIAVQTGSKSGAGTDSVITLTLGDDNGATLRLNNIAQYGLNGPSYDYFEKGQLDHFSYKDNKAACLDVCNIIVTSDNSGYKPGWYLSSVETMDPQFVHQQTQQREERRRLQLQRQRIRARERRQAMTAEQRERHLAQRRAAYHQRRRTMQQQTSHQLNLPIQEETSHQLNLPIQNEGNAFQQISRPSHITEHDQQQSQLPRRRIRDRERRQAMTAEQRQHHLAQRRAAYHRRRQQHINQPIEREGSALEQISVPTRITQHHQRQSQLERRRIRDTERRQAMTAEQRQLHLAQRRNADHRRRRQPTRTTHNSARNFTESGASSSHRLQDPTFCNHCTAKLFQHETQSLCCEDGKTVLPPINSPQEIRTLYTDQSEEGQHFRRHIRSYNHVFSFTSMGVHIDNNLANAREGVYTFRAQGSIYHKIGSLLPHPHSRPRFLQLYIYDTDHEIDNRLAENTDLDRRIIDRLQHILDTYNQFVHHFRQLSRHSNIHTCKLIIKEQPSNQRQYTLPSASQVAAIIVGDDETSYRNGRDIIVQTTSGSLMTVQEAVGYYDPLQYPLLLPYGSYGWDINSQNNTGVRVTCREFYAYLLQIREHDTSLFLHGGRLLQQYSVDNYVKIESNRMRWVRKNQTEIRSELYIGLQDALNAGENNADSMEVLSK